MAFPAKSYEDENGDTKWQGIVKIPDENRWKKFQNLALKALDEVLNEEQITGDVTF